MDYREKKKELDIRGLVCPQLVTSTRKALKEITEGTISVLADNPESKENVRRFAASQGCEVSATEKEGIFYLEIIKDHPGGGGKRSETQKEYGKT